MKTADVWNTSEAVFQILSAHTLMTLCMDQEFLRTQLHKTKMNMEQVNKTCFLQNSTFQPGPTLTSWYTGNSTQVCRAQTSPSSQHTTQKALSWCGRHNWSTLTSQQSRNCPLTLSKLA